MEKVVAADVGKYDNSTSLIVSKVRFFNLIGWFTSALGQIVPRVELGLVFNPYLCGNLRKNENRSQHGGNGLLPVARQPS